MVITLKLLRNFGYPKISYFTIWTTPDFFPFGGEKWSGLYSTELFEGNRVGGGWEVYGPNAYRIAPSHFYPCARNRVNILLSG